MTTTTTETARTISEPTGLPLPAGVEFQWVAPGDLLLDVNVRADVTLGADFLASIHDLGVRTPVLAVRTPEGLRVREGQRRTLAAVETGREGMPVYVIPDTGDVDRIVGQLAENYDRAAMTERDTAVAFEQLSLLGLSAAQIAKRTRRTRAEITAGLTVAKSTAAAKAAGLYALDLVSAATFAEFDGDADATETLRQTAERGGSLAHAAQRIRDARTRTDTITTAKDALTSQGITVVPAPSPWYATGLRAVSALRTKGHTEPLTDEAHATCPHHVAWVEYDEDAATATAVYGCSDYKNAGHLKWTDPATKTSTVSLSEAERAERRKVRENNAAWRSAQTVRREWLATIARRKTPPKGAAELVARAVVEDTTTLSRAADQGHQLAARLLGHKDTYGGSRHIADTLAKATTPRAQVITLTVVLAAIEESTGTHTWRDAYPTGTVARYLSALETWGYDLSDIEQTTCGRTPNPDPEPQAADAA